ncbi:MAG: D-alanine--D-alanine ligase [candidate division NC10 bacterium]|nr:D-alanine--D-alanine ligase [candidate division NC10 bacterium]
MKKLRVLALMHERLVPPDDPTGVDLATVDWKTEYDVVTTLREMGHEVQAVGVGSDLAVIRRAVDEWKPHIAFNLLEEFDGVAIYDQNVVAYLELLRIPYTGCNPRGLMLARDKALSKKILAYHRLLVPEFAVFPLGRAVRRRKRLSFPLIVKSVSQEASLGISQASIVDNEEKLRERVAFIHKSVGTNAIVERYIEGRELYVGVLGNMRLRVFPIWELFLGGMPDEVRHIATARVKWSPAYREKHGIKSGEAKGLPEGMPEGIRHLAKRVFRALNLSGYARLDLRLDPNGKVHVLEANPNPEVAYGEDFAESAEKAGVSYEALLQRLLQLGLRWRPDRLG